MKSGHCSVTQSISSTDEKQAGTALFSAHCSTQAASEETKLEPESKFQ